MVFLKPTKYACFESFHIENMETPRFVVFSFFSVVSYKKYPILFVIF